MVNRKFGLVLLFSLVLVMLLVLAQPVILPSSFSINQTAQNVFNFSVNNTDATVDLNITNVTALLPSGFEFISSTNGTDSSGVFSNTSNVLVWSVDGLVMNLTKKFFWFNATASTPGEFNITVTTYNTTGWSIVSNISVFVNDTTAPEVTFISPLSESNISGASYIINATVNESYSVVSAVYFNVTNSTGNVTVLKVATNTSASSWNATLNTVILADGLYNITAIVNDSANNINRSVLVLNFGVDNTVPIISSVSSGDPSTTSATITWTTDQDANTSVNYGTSSSLGTTTSSVTMSTDHSKAISSLAASTTYYYNVTSCDSAGNCNTSGPNSFTTDAVSSGDSADSGAGGGADSMWGTTFTTLNSTQFTQGYTKELLNKTRIGFKVGTITHYVGLIGIDNTNKRVRLNVSSTPQIKLLNLNEEWKVDVSNDGYYDILVKAVSMNSYKVNVSMIAINEKMPTVQSNQSINNSISAAVVRNSSQNASLNSSISLSDISKLDNTGLISVVVVLIIIVVIVLLWIGYLRKYVFDKKVQRSVRYTDSKR